MCRIIERWFIYYVRLFFGTKCPHCGAYHSHSPSCVLASKRELLTAYMWTQGAWAEDKERRMGVERRLYDRISELESINKIRTKEVQNLNAKIRKMSNGQAT